MPGWGWGGCAGWATGCGGAIGWAIGCCAGGAWAIGAWAIGAAAMPGGAPGVPAAPGCGFAGTPGFAWLMDGGSSQWVDLVLWSM